MIGRHQLAVRSPIEARALGASLLAMARNDGFDFAELSRELRARFDACRVTFTDRGTSALVLALRLAAGEGATVAYPAFCCVDLAAAAVRAKVRVRLYDVDPATLSPDPESVDRVLRRGASALVAAHLYGYPVDLPTLQCIAAAHGVPIIEDAAQAARGSLNGVPSGAFGDLTVLSFGRGKGMTGGNGGALLTREPRWLPALERLGKQLGGPPAGLGDVAQAAGTWALARPELYAIPAAIPWLRLGETVYRPAGEPAAMSRAAVALVRRSFAGAERELETRRRNAARLERYAAEAVGVTPIATMPGASPGYLRLAVRERAGRARRHTLGIMPAYPMTLAEQPELAALRWPVDRPLLGAEELKHTLVTLPTHGFLAERDLRDIETWLGAARGRLMTSERQFTEASVLAARSWR